MKTLVFSLLLSALISHSALASGGSASHGGDVVACFNSGAVRDRHYETIQERRRDCATCDPLENYMMNDIVSAQLLDLFETSSGDPTRFSETLGSASSSSHYEVWIDEILQNLAVTHAPVYRQIRKNQEVLPQFSFSFVNSGVYEVNDSHEAIYIPNHCLLFQLATQQTLPNQTRRVLIDTRLFRLLPALHKAALFTHEWLLVAGIGDRFDSPTVRFINGSIFLKHFRPENGHFFARSLFIQDMPENRGNTINCPQTEDELTYCYTYDGSSYPSILRSVFNFRRFTVDQRYTTTPAMLEAVKP